ncbi:unnamed protein product [Adineta steineri]|uniref:Uncharacterized protein n=1 Tax=Adineta steineri TaxID=433720 RepID=A0A815VFV4_9BILA|nr:unnamed protein product [Adineta steineri]
MSRIKQTELRNEEIDNLAGHITDVQQEYNEKQLDQVNKEIGEASVSLVEEILDFIFDLTKKNSPIEMKQIFHNDLYILI